MCVLGWMGSMVTDFNQGLVSLPIIAPSCSSRSCIRNVKAKLAFQIARSRLLPEWEASFQWGLKKKKKKKRHQSVSPVAFVAGNWIARTDECLRCGAPLLMTPPCQKPPPLVRAGQEVKKKKDYENVLDGLFAASRCIIRPNMQNLSGALGGGSVAGTHTARMSLCGNTHAYKHKGGGGLEKNMYIYYCLLLLMLSKYEIETVQRRPEHVHSGATSTLVPPLVAMVISLEAQRWDTLTCCTSCKRNNIFLIPPCRFTFSLPLFFFTIT